MVQWWGESFAKRITVQAAWWAHKLVIERRQPHSEERTGFVQRMKQRFNGRQSGGGGGGRREVGDDKASPAKGWLLALLGITTLSAATIALLHRRNRQRRSSNSRVVAGANGHGRADTRFGLAHARSLSDTFAWNADGVDIGAVLGVDIGGTLSKLVYFEKKAPSAAQPAGRRPSGDDPMGKKVTLNYDDCLLYCTVYTARRT